jgi:hypothetical protein
MNSKTVLQKIMTLLSKEEVKFTYARLKDGTIVESPTFDVNEPLEVVSEDGTKIPAPNGWHELELKDTEGNETYIKVYAEDGVIKERENVELEDVKVEDTPQAGNADKENVMPEVPGQIASGTIKAAEVDEVSKLYNKDFPDIPIYKTDTTTAEMTKFFINVFLATKVSFCNEIFDICNSLDINYNDVINLALLDNRIGSSHTKVPGDPTDKALHGRGFGLTCFPINLSILIDLANKLEVDTKILKAVKLRNDTIDRPEKDWLIENKTIVKK